MIGSSVRSSRSSKPSEDSVTLTHHHWAFTQQDIWLCCITVSLHLWQACGCVVVFLISREKKKISQRSDHTSQEEEQAPKIYNPASCKLARALYRAQLTDTTTASSFAIPHVGLKQEGQMEISVLWPLCACLCHGAISRSEKKELGRLRQESNTTGFWPSQLW